MIKDNHTQQIYNVVKGEIVINITTPSQSNTLETVSLELGKSKIIEAHKFNHLPIQFKTFILVNDRIPGDFEIGIVDTNGAVTFLGKVNTFINSESYIPYVFPCVEKINELSIKEHDQGNGSAPGCGKPIYLVFKHEVPPKIGEDNKVINYFIPLIFAESNIFVYLKQEPLLNQMDPIELILLYHFSHLDKTIGLVDIAKYDPELRIFYVDQKLVDSPISF